MTTETPVEQAIAVMEGFRERIRAIGKSSPAIEQFIDEMLLLLSVHVNPTTALDALFAALAAMKPENRAKAIGAEA